MTDKRTEKREQKLPGPREGSPEKSFRGGWFLWLHSTGSVLEAANCKLQESLPARRNDECLRRC